MVGMDLSVEVGVEMESENVGLTQWQVEEWGGLHSTHPVLSTAHSLTAFHSLLFTHSGKGGERSR